MWLYVTDALAILALISMTAAAAGMARARDVFVRIRAASQAVVLGVLPLLLATVATGDGALIAQGVLLGFVLMLTTTVTSHAIGRLEYVRERRSGEGDQEREREQA